MRRKRAGIVAAVTVVLSVPMLGLALPSAGAEARSTEVGRPRPVIFVHGFVGSGAQFESQAMRFTSNGYPAGLIAVEEYDSTFATTTMAKVWGDLDRLVSQLLTKSGADKVDLVGHSLGTAVSQGYLGSS